MRGLSLIQPYASLVAAGEKLYETRSWRTNYRGDVAIHASKGDPAWARELEHLVEFARALAREPRPLPTGAIIAVADLVTCVRAEHAPVEALGTAEPEFGDFATGRWAWRLENPRRLATPLRYKGSLGLWSIAPDVEAQIERQLARR